MATTTSLTASLAVRDPSAVGHSSRVTALSLRLARTLRAGEVVEDAIRSGGPLHDVGKLEVEADILRKAGPLDPAELSEIRRHPVAGARIVAAVESLGRGLACVLHHHERWDGTGYPHGLAGAAIPLEARIVAVADAYDAMISERPYRRALTRSDALAEVDRCAGTQFDPAVAGALIRLEQRPSAP